MVNGPGDGPAPTWVVASDSRGAAEDLPQQRGVLPTVLSEHILQGLCPVELIEDDGGCGGRGGLGWEAPRLSPAEPHHNDTMHVAPLRDPRLFSAYPGFPHPRPQPGLHQLRQEDVLVLIPSRVIEAIARPTLWPGPTCSGRAAVACAPWRGATQVSGSWRLGCRPSTLPGASGWSPGSSPTQHALRAAATRKQLRAR